MNIIQKSLTSAISLALLSTSAFAADFNFKFQSSDPSGDKNFQVQKEWTERVEQMSGGRIEIDLLPVGAVVKHTETLGAIKMGVIDGHITATGYFTGQDPAFGLIGNMVGAWSDTRQLLQYINYGGGYELMTELYAPYGVKYIGGSTTGVESFVSKVPLNGVDDLKGLKLRAPEGLVQQVFAAAGATPVNLPGSEVFTGLSKGVIDAADYTVFSTNHQAGMNDIATHPVQPGFHSLPTIDISMSQKKWDKLPADLQEIMTVSVRDFAEDITTQLRIADQKAVKEAEANPNITIHDWSEEERKKFRLIAMGEWEKYAELSPNAKKVYDSITTYLKDSGLL
ncbi:MULTISPECIES: TRAP transporter substrate-binding protein [Vibrio]|jgi:TRAP-type mannitol/chloroaromatic compound transport system substrate-binding protein|uniref:C4-dicarboxylate ABC transporter substrate-binding protein n=1 Tax=Vibrio natriegens NBRC 15636 = ATCC 14048 = DSM 759 TaxID=1219067 RepID=A0AAN0Y7H8_VIBNA|nr:MULTISPECIES: TRAP transporter substrate-binding protein [Vibrio]MEE3876561.1 TRAP transporter substrate-binding protein [Vibrio sp. YYF0003]WMN88921.1 TRAP transporter substrate-binding protein [Vibrio parahaemolyticus]CAH0528503.1 Lactate-binding periplasmic protein [Catenococcus thiocycli]AEX24184.1 TRAP dicarboxylate transporter subunit DctP [Vibrio sp. EJY3]ALR18096.1 C4-dicarboxylate ABC transporter substrate-binding protein [Vibrio natriegens NBRC 15636 = ATCC 14048 = DSM 759]